MKSSKRRPKPAMKDRTGTSGNRDLRPGGLSPDEIRLRAYEIYLERGRIDGQDVEHWLQAENELTAFIVRLTSK